MGLLKFAVTARNVLGLDIGSYGIKAVELNTSGAQPVVTNFGYEEVGAGGTEATIRALSTLVERCRFRASRVVSSVSGRNVIVRYVNVREMSDEDLKRSMQYEADKYIPFSTTEVVIDCQRLAGVEPATGEMKVLLVAVKRNVIEEHLDILKSAGLYPSIIDVDSFALGNAFNLCFAEEIKKEEKPKVRALVDIGATKTNINILWRLESRFTREVYVAGNDFTEAIARRLAVDPFEVERLKKEPGERESEIREAIGSILDDLQSEIQLSFDFYENEFEQEVDEIFLSGGSSVVPGVLESFSQAFNRPVQRWAPTDRLSLSLSPETAEQARKTGPQLAVVVGLAGRTYRG